MKKEYNLKKMKVKKRGAVLSKDVKVMKTIRLDVDLVKWLLKEADKRGIGYQTLINILLTEKMNSKPSRETLRKEIRQIVREELKKVA